jgi:hypothetical protein
LKLNQAACRSVDYPLHPRAIISPALGKSRDDFFVATPFQPAELRALFL